MLFVWLLSCMWVFVQEFSKMGNYSAHLIENVLLTLDVLGPKCSTPTQVQFKVIFNVMGKLLLSIYRSGRGSGLMEWLASSRDTGNSEGADGRIVRNRQGSASYSRTEETWEVRRHAARANRKLELTDTPTTVLVKLSWQKKTHISLRSPEFEDEGIMTTDGWDWKVN